MKILFVIPTLSGGGAERVASILANRLVEENEVSFFTLEKTKVDLYALNSKVSIKSAEFDPPRGNKAKAVLSFVKNMFTTYKRLALELDAEKPDVVISLLPKADFLVFWLHKNRDFRWIASERNDPWVRNRIERIVLEYIYRKSDALVCQTEKVANYYRRKKVANTLVIPNLLKTPVTANPEEIIKKYGRYVIAMGRLDHQKNYPMMIKAFLKAIAETDIKLLVLGDGPCKAELENLIQSLHGVDAIVLIGRTNRTDDYLAGAEFFMMSSNFEGMPNALLEALSHGLPCICTDFRTGAARELIGSEAGFVIPVGDDSAMTEAIKKMLKLPEEDKKNMRLAALKTVKHMDQASIYEAWERQIKGAYNE